MTLPDQTPKLPKWFFLLSDALLLAVAAFIASHSVTPLSPTVIFAIVGCVATGAVITALAFVADYTRRQDEALDDRQRALESLARTVASSAEQISIAAGGLHEIAELVQKNLRHAEHLPHKLQEKIAEFQAQLANANDVEKEELEKELVELRASESERLESTSDKIAKSAAEWTKLEAATQKHFTAAFATLDAKLAALEAAANIAPAAADVPPPASAAIVAPVAAMPDASAAEPSAAASPKAESTAHPPKRPRKPRRESTGADETPAPPAAETSPPASFGDPQLNEPPPIPAATIPEIAPAAPQTKEPFAAPVASPPPAEPSSIASPEAAAEAPAPKPARKRAPKKPAPAPDATEPALSLGLDEPSAPASGVVERVLTSDGATRLLVTAYIGIGNRLFVRGEGPGLSWSKGVPLQFVSIGKWRWETSDATAPVKFKLYKNDEVECAALGLQSLDPGHQHEVTAAF